MPCGSVRNVTARPSTICWKAASWFDWRYLYLNAAAARHNRRPNEELLGRKVTEVCLGVEKYGFYPWLRRCMEERISHSEETDFTFPDGSSGWFDMRIQPVREGIFILSVDITERRKAEEDSRPSGV